MNRRIRDEGVLIFLLSLSSISSIQCLNRANCSKGSVVDCDYDVSGYLHLHFRAFSRHFCPKLPPVIAENKD